MLKNIMVGSVSSKKQTSKEKGKLQKRAQILRFLGCGLQKT